MFKKDDTSKSSGTFPLDDSPKEKNQFASGPPAVIGSSLVVDGSIKGQEDLLIEGRVEGDINLPNNVVTVGTGGEVKAKIQAAVIVVEGKVDGDLVGEEQIEIRRSGNVLGNIIAPRVGLEDGAQFKGNIDMSPKSKAPQQQSSSKSTVNVDNNGKSADADKAINQKFSG